MALPTFFIIGAAKAGTSSLHYYLDQHPQIQMSAIKEPRFFAGPPNGIPYPPDRIWDLDEYECLFDPAFEVRGEASTDYAAYPRRQGAAERIRESVPTAKFIYLVRDPIGRTLSHYQMGVALMGERRSINAALGDLSDLSSPYIASSLYATQLEFYLRHFPPERTLVIDQADLLARRNDVLRTIFTFLGVDNFAREKAFDEELLNSQEWRRYSPHYLIWLNRYVTPRVRWIPQSFRKSIRRSVERILWPPLEPPLLDYDLRLRLEELYLGETDRLRQMTGMAFESWGV